jgi:hypothetical protein
VFSSHTLGEYAATCQFPTFEESINKAHYCGFKDMITGKKLEKLVGNLTKDSSLSVHLKMLIREKPLQVLCPLLQDVCIPLISILDIFQLQQTDALPVIT